jgi:hypothetical protein
VLSLIRVSDGTKQGWLSTAGMIWFKVEQVSPLQPSWLAVQGFIPGEYYDTIVVIRADEVLGDVEVLQTALRELPSVKEWGYRIAVGPVGPTSAVLFRDPEWDEQEPPDDPNEAFRGLVIWDLAACRVIQRIEYDGDLQSGATLGGDEHTIAIQARDHVDLVARATGAVQRVEAIALDPFSLEVASLGAGGVSILPAAGPRERP